jgi:hypothetical protein
VIFGVALVLAVTVTWAGALAAVRRGTALNGLTMGAWAAPWWGLIMFMAMFRVL